jgi:SAM-dependent methyltransferase
VADNKQLRTKSTGCGDSQLMLPHLACTLPKTEMATAPKLLSLTQKILPASEQSVSAYAPLASVWHGEDAELLERLLSFYPRKKPRKILDATINGGRFWRDSKRPVIGIDIDKRHRPTLIADNTRMPFADASFDVVVYDPPHIPNQGKDKSKDFNTRFGLVLRSTKENRYTFTHTFPPFVKETFRVLKPEGILLCKTTDYVHHHRYQWAHIEFINAAREAGLMPCDCIIKIRKGPIIDPKWKNAHHSRRQHCYWLIFRKSKKCE